MPFHKVAGVLQGGMPLKEKVPSNITIRMSGALTVIAMFLSDTAAASIGIRNGIQAIFITGDIIPIMVNISGFRNGKREVFGLVPGRGGIGVDVFIASLFLDFLLIIGARNHLLYNSNY